MEYVQTVTLALIQGITEFLPISSSAHLILPAQLLGWEDQGLAFDIAVHVGSLAAVVAYFYRDLSQYAVSATRLVLQRHVDKHAEELGKLAIATLPVVVAGVLLKDWVEAELRSVLVIAATTILFGLLLGYADRRHGDRPTVTWRDAVFIGCAQVLALVPGTSRSGITITAALLIGLSRTGAARFSFLLSIPTIAGAGLLAGMDLVAEENGAHAGVLATAALISGVAAYACISAFIGLVERTGMMPYVVYRVLLGVGLLAWVLMSNAV